MSSIRQHKATSFVIINSALLRRVVFEAYLGLFLWDLHDPCCFHVLLTGRWVLSVGSPSCSIMSLAFICYTPGVNEVHLNFLVKICVYGSTVCIKVPLPLHTSLLLSREILEWKLFKRSLNQIFHPNPPDQNKSTKQERVWATPHASFLRHGDSECMRLCALPSLG